MPRHFPPGPPDWLFGVGQIRQMQADPLAYYQDLQRVYGDVVYTRLGPYHDYVFYHPEQIREVLVTKSKSFQKMARVRNILSKLGGDGLSASEGDKWLRQRRLVQPAFHPKRFGRYAEEMVDRARRLVDRWRDQLRANRVCEIEMTQAMSDLTLEVIAKTLFDAELSEQTAAIVQAVACLSDIMVREMSSMVILPDWLPLPEKRRKRRAISVIDETARRFIREHRASGIDRGDLLSMLLLAVDEEGDGSGMTDEQARDEAVTLLTAGSDTTAAGLTWLFYNLARFPDLTDRVCRELQAVVGDRAPTAADLPRLQFLDRALKETLRLFPPAIGVFTRQALTDVEIGGYVLTRGSLVHIFSLVTQRDPRWFADPERFDPERFAPERAAQIPPFAYFPFGGGPRSCIGNSFAVMEMILVAATMLQQLRPALAPGQTAPVLQAHMALRPKGGMRLRWSAQSEV